MCHVSDVVAEGISIMIFREIDKPRGGFASLLENGMTLMGSWVRWGYLVLSGEKGKDGESSACAHNWWPPPSPTGGCGAASSWMQ